MVVWIIIFRPFTDLVDNASNIFDNLMYTIAILLIFIIHMTQDIASMEVRNYIFGNLVILCLTLIISSNLILGVFICIKSIVLLTKRLVSSNTKVQSKQQVVANDESSGFVQKNQILKNVDEGSKKAIMVKHREGSGNTTETNPNLSIKVHVRKKTVLGFEDDKGFQRTSN